MAKRRQHRLLMRPVFTLTRKVARYCQLASEALAASFSTSADAEVAK